MTDPTPQTTPTRDEAAPMTTKRWPFVESPGDFAMRLEAAYFAFDSDMLAAVRNCLIENPPMLASAPAPASGRVDAVAWRTVSDFVDEMLRDWPGGDDCRMGFGLNGATVTKGQFRAVQAALAALPPAAMPVSEAEPVVWRDVLAECRRQVEAEGWTAAHDDEHGNGEMARAAASYALEHAAWTYTETPSARLMEAARSVWPWGKQWWKPGPGRRMLVKAAALILAEIERLDRKEGAR